MTVIATASATPEMLASARERRPDVLVLGPLADSSRRDATRAVKEATPASAVVVLAEEQETEDFVPAMEAGASGYLTTSCSAAQLADAALRVAEGEIVVLGVGRGRAAAAPNGDGDRTPVVLTSREREIMRLICAGRSNQQIARELFISAHTVRTHIQNIRVKLNVRSKLEAALITLNGPAASAVRTVVDLSGGAGAAPAPDAAREGSPNGHGNGHPSGNGDGSGSGNGHAGPSGNGNGHAAHPR